MMYTYTDIYVHDFVWLLFKLRIVNAGEADSIDFDDMDNIRKLRQFRENLIKTDSNIT